MYQYQTNISVSFLYKCWNQYIGICIGLIWIPILVKVSVSDMTVSVSDMTVSVSDMTVSVKL